MREGWTYEALVSEAVTAPSEGWSFGFLKGRVRSAEIPWSYEEIAAAAMSKSTRLLDLDTGGGETLADVLAMVGSEQRPARIVATEAWQPNLPVARRRLEPLGIAVRQSTAGESLPADEGEFDLVLNRHGAGHPAELRRVLAPSGIYLTQGVGRNNDIELNEALDGPPPQYHESASLDGTVSALEDNGFEIERAREAFVEFGFRDIGAVVFHLGVVSWQVPGFDVEKYDLRLRELDDRIRKDGEFVVRHHRFLIRAVRR